MTVHRVSDPAVKAAFDAYPQLIREPLENLRSTILDVALAIPGIGPLEESLKWGQPAYRPIRPRTGTTVRIGQWGGNGPDYALYVHCQTNLMDEFRSLYTGRFRFDGQRAVVFQAGEVPPDDALRHCIALALTYHAREASNVKAPPKTQRAQQLVENRV